MLLLMHWLHTLRTFTICACSRTLDTQALTYGSSISTRATCLTPFHINDYPCIIDILTHPLPFTHAFLLVHSTRPAPALATSKSTSALPATSTIDPVTPPTINTFAPSLPAIPSLSFSGADDGDDMDLATPDNSMTAGGLVLGANPAVGVGMPSFTGMAGSESPSPPKPFGTGSSNAPVKATKSASVE